MSTTLIPTQLFKCLCPSLDPNDPWHATYITRKSDAQAKNLAQIKAAYCKVAQNINFVDPIHTRRAYEALIHEVSTEAICIGIKYSLKTEPMYFKCDKCIPPLVKHFPGILQKILGCDHQRLEHMVEHHINGNFSHDNQHQEIYNPNLAFTHQVTAPINHWGPVVSEASLLASVL